MRTRIGAEKMAIDNCQAEMMGYDPASIDE